MIRFACGHCGQSLKVQDGLEGKGVRCPKCGQRNTVPAPQVEEEVHEESHDELVSDSPLGALAAMASGGAAAAPKPPARPAAVMMPKPPTEPAEESPEPTHEEEPAPVPAARPSMPVTAAQPVSEAAAPQVAVPTPTSAAVGYSSPAKLPGYAMLMIVSYLLIAFGVLGILGSFYTLIRGLITVFRNLSGDVLYSALTGVVAAFGAGLAASIGVIAAGLVALAIRDIARNTHSLRSR